MILRALPSAETDPPTFLSRLTSGPQPAPRRTLVYGVQGVGKSTFASQAPGAVFLPTEDGMGDIDCTRFPLLRSYDEVLAALGDLYTAQHDFHTVVIDSADWLETLVWDRTAKDRGVSSIEDFAYKAGYFHAVEYWRKILDGLDALRRERSMAAVLIAHSRIERFEAPDTDSYDRYVPRVHRLVAELLCEWADEVLFAAWKVYTKTLTEKFNRERTQGFTTGERVLRTTERPSHIAKNRLGLPDELPLSWQEYQRHFPQKGEPS